LDDELGEEPEVRAVAQGDDPRAAKPAERREKPGPRPRAVAPEEVAPRGVDDPAVERDHRRRARRERPAMPVAETLHEPRLGSVW
jgi:hypothetical protein